MSGKRKRNSNQDVIDVVPDKKHKTTTSGKDKQSKKIINNLQDYLANNLNINVLSNDERKSIIITSDDLNDPDNEIFLIDCPQSIDPNEICGKKIKLPPEQSSIVKIPDSNINIFIENFTNEKSINLLLKDNENNSLNLINSKVSGLMKIQLNIDSENLLKTLKKTEGVAEDKVPFPQNLKLRHPLLGVDYVKKKISKRIRKKLEEAKIQRFTTIIKKEERDSEPESSYLSS